MNIPKFLRVLDQFVSHHCVVGAEAPFYSFLAKELKKRGAKVSRYSGLLVAEGKDPDSIAVSAHVDRHGLICTGPGEFQYAAFEAGFRGWQTGDTVSEVMFAKIAERFHNERVYGYEPWTGKVLAHGRIKSALLCERRNDMLFEIEGLERILPGTPIAYHDRLKKDGSRLSAQLDNVLNVAIQVYLFEIGFQGRAFFTAQEEVGRSWRYLLEWFLREDQAISRILVLDTSPFPDVESAERQQLLLRNRDSSAEFNPEAVEWVRGECEALEITYAFKDELVEKQNLTSEKLVPLGRTELGRAINGSGERINGTTIQIPTTGYHTAEESTSRASVEAMIRLLLRLSQTR